MDARGQLKQVGDFRDTDGRPLAERGSLETSGVPFTMKPCPYPDARLGGEMNVDALRQMRTHWDDILSTIQTLNRDDRTIYPDPVSPVTRFRRLTRVMGSLPEFLVLYKDTRSDRIPVLASTLYKVSRGLNTLANRLTFGPSVVPTGLTPDTQTPAIAAEFYAFIEEHRLLVGQTEVCAGPKSMIVDVLEALLAQGDGQEDARSPLDVLLSPGQRHAAVRYGSGLSDFLLVHAYFARAFDILSGVPNTPDADHRPAIRKLAALHALPFVATPAVEPAALAALMSGARARLSSVIVRRLDRIPETLAHDLEAIWVQAMTARQRAMAALAVDLGVTLRLDITVRDIPARPSLHADHGSAPSGGA